MNETMRKFGYPATLVAEFEHWTVLLRPAQPTLGSLVLAAKSDVTALSDLSAEAHAEMKAASTAIERALRDFTGYAKINYLMLMMVDPHVHAHVIPRYEGSRQFEGVDFPDAGWPKLPDLGTAVTLDEDQIASLVTALKTRFA
ncbi:MAG: HIT family protein [Croceicoccus sp.]|nr:HIT family protein [Croceicoccus sp.]MAL26502.1 HIT family protein [Croceicoccus sp.]|tara:strand:- start:3027 stop:3455 length:429 start_codon:yes stop_codon:yes gene_type:complete